MTAPYDRNRGFRSARELLDKLRALRQVPVHQAADEKFRLLRDLLRTRTARAKDVIGLHDELLFAAAFPGSDDIHKLAERALSGFAVRVGKLIPSQRRAVDNGGIAGTTSTRVFCYDIALWLSQNREAVAVDWEAMEHPECLDVLIRQMLFSTEIELFDSGSMSTEDWIVLATRKSRTSALRWLLDSLPEQSAGVSVRAWRDLYDAAEVQLSWEHGRSVWSVSRNRAPIAAPVIRHGFRRTPVNVASHVTTPLRSIKRLPRSVAGKWRNACIAALAARGREVSPTLGANPEEIYVASLGGGADLCILGVAADDRLPLEANYGYVMFANGVPIGYGGVTALAAQANTGINLFDSFRGSEAGFLFVQALRAFHTLFGVTRFLVNAYQVGDDNDEALDSGAYWFYHRLGFRSHDEKVAALAEAERARNMKRPGRRSSRSVLRRLASSDMVLQLPSSGELAIFEERWLLTIGREVARFFSSSAAGTRQESVLQLARQLCNQLTGEERNLRAEEIAGAMHLVPVIALLQKEVTRWPAADRLALWDLVRLKGSLRERSFAQASSVHAGWWETLAAYCRILENTTRP